MSAYHVSYCANYWMITWGPNENDRSFPKWPFWGTKMTVLETKMTVLVSKMTVLDTPKLTVLIYQNDRSFAPKMTVLYDQNDRSIKCTKWPFFLPEMTVLFNQNDRSLRVQIDRSMWRKWPFQDTKMTVPDDQNDRSYIPKWPFLWDPQNFLNGRSNIPKWPFLYTKMTVPIRFGKMNIVMNFSVWTKMTGLRVISGLGGILGYREGWGIIRVKV